MMAESNKRQPEPQDQYEQPALMWGWLGILAAFALAFIWWVVMWSPVGIANSYNYLIGGEGLKLTANLVLGTATIGLAGAGVVMIAAGSWYGWRHKVNERHAESQRR
ncbi:MAG: hypothetical protein FJ318_09720 [SAR202 cluster bacterium]|nr:hypothetical protein [SAR202 cluster bacterium]